VITASQGTAGPTAVRLTGVPPGPGAISLANVGTASPVYVGVTSGTSGSVTTSNGFPLILGNTPLVIPLYAGSLGGSLSAITASGAANIAWFISTATGQTGP
jgi:hypothetical protein